MCVLKLNKTYLICNDGINVMITRYAIMKAIVKNTLVIMSVTCTYDEQYIIF